MTGDLSEREIAQALIASLDLTDLSDRCTREDVAALCDRAATSEGDVAAICIWPRFVAFARPRLKSGIRIATVVNFPEGGEDVEATLAETRQALADGADEIDLVVSYRRLAADEGFVDDQVRRVKEACGEARLKAILETGELAEPVLIGRAAKAALAGGADFLKTSTGKVAVNATPEAAEILLRAIADHGGAVGFKPAGGIRTYEDAKAYRDLANRLCGDGYATPDRFRLGASAVLADLLAVAGGAARGPGLEGY
ncbi:deoxyribose-phosphate aldolase [Aureimonas endophytica]|uniref:Deoxyribose-phosphate aldolase n=1 Tax=Aureimonas endophytica TaxID=2027858 RepID=A0A916ZRZ6_9HYPH|nr:deoxyribose-phosphate aldolase [Aureimonas endophytica]GGE09530.1 deoxyribose-phosphate aldolase [Aureimonas endophytica]